MNTKNILKTQFKILPIFKRFRNKPKKWQNLFNFKNLEHNLLINNSFIINGCSIKQKNSNFICYPLNYKKPDDLKLKSFQDLDLSIINSLNNFKPVIFNSLEELIFYMYLDLIFMFLEESNDTFMNLLKEKEMFFNKFYRPTILEVNKHSIYLEKIGNKCYCNKKINDNLVETFLSLKIKSLELPIDYDITKTINSLKEFKELMDKIKMPIKSRNFNLKFKKLGTYKDDGFYSKETNTIIIDPRKTEVFSHELGHMIYDNQIKINKKIKSANSEEYAQKFQLFLGK